MQTVESARKGTCVVTFDVAGSIQSLRQKGIQVPNREDPIFAKMHRILLEKISRAFPKTEIAAIEKNGLRYRIWKVLDDLVNGHAVLVTCSEMAALNPDPNGLNLSINRLFDKDGKMLGYGPRPGYDYLSKQFDELVRKIAGRPVVLAKEGAFRGNTCCHILDELKNRGVSVVVIVMGFCDTGAKDLIRQKFNGEFVEMTLFDRLIEWIADRDLIPFMPGCGRVLGETSIHSVMPVKTPEGHSCAFPYVLPFGKAEKWMSITMEQAADLSSTCLDLAIELFSRLELENGREIMAGEILSNNPRVSTPVIVGGPDQIPDPKVRIVRFLEEVRKSI